MKNFMQGSRLQEIKQADMVDYLASLGIAAVKVRRGDYWYLSPFREERTASFKVNRPLNRWYDFGEGIGGSLIDFGVRYYRCSIGEFIRSFRTNLPLKMSPKPAAERMQDLEKIIVKDAFPIRSKALEQYILSRGIKLDMARQYCHEVVFGLYGKTWYAIGFLNDKGGYELRNQFFKGSSSPKAPSMIKIGAENLSLFEGFFDFLSYLMIAQEVSFPTDFLILNSLAFAEPSTSLLSSYKRSFLYFDHDSAGQNCSQNLKNVSPVVKDNSSFYRGYNDLNEAFMFERIDSLFQSWNFLITSAVDGVGNPLP